MNKLLNILGPAIIALTSATTVNVLNNSNYVSNHIYQTEETTMTFEYQAKIAVNENDSSQPQTGTFDVSESLVNLITEMKTFIAENNVINFEIQAFQSIFTALQVEKPTTGYKVNAINEAFQFALKNNDAKIKLTMEIKQQWIASYSFTLKGEITDAAGEKTYKFDFSTYHNSYVYSAYQLLQGFSNNIILNYDVQTLDHVDSDYETGVKIKNLGSSWYAHQVKDIFNYEENEYYDIARNYIQQTLNLNGIMDSLYAIGTQKVIEDLDSAGEWINGLLPGDSYLNNELITAKAFYVVFESFELSGQFKMLVQIYG